MGKKLQFATLGDLNIYIKQRGSQGARNVVIVTEVDLTDRQVRNIVGPKKQGPKLGKKNKPGRKGVLTKAQKASIRNKSRAHPHKSCQAVARELGPGGSKKAAPRYPKGIGWPRKKAPKVPKLKNNHQSKRYEWAKNHRYPPWTRAAPPDGAPFTLGQCRYGWPPRGCGVPQQTGAYPPKVPIWGAVPHKGFVYFGFYGGNPKSSDYIRILNNGFIDAAYELMGGDWALQQDGAKPHGADDTMEFLGGQVPEVLTWPANSCDLSPIGGLRGFLKQRVYSHDPQDIGGLKMWVREEIGKITKKECQSLIRTTKGRVATVIENEGNTS